MSAPNRLHNGRPYQRLRRAIGLPGAVCHICGHPGSTDADLVVPRAIAPQQPMTPSAYRPAHGVRGCPTCKRKCNQERGAKPIDAMWKPKLEW